MIYQERGKMKKNNNIGIGICLLFACAFVNVIFSTDINAASCDSFLNGTTVWDDGTTLHTRNPSLFNACRWNNGSTNSQYGALWLNDNPAWNAFSSNVTVGSGVETKNVYLHGVAIGGASNTANFVKIVRGNKYMAEHNCEDSSCRVEYEDIDEWAHPSQSDRFKNNPEFWSYGAISGWGDNDSIFRPAYGFYENFYDNGGVRGGLKLDVKAFKRLENGLYLDKSVYGGSVTYGTNKDTYKIPLQIFRCNSSSGNSVYPGPCYSDTSWLTVDLPKSWYAGVAMALGTTDSTANWQSYKNNGGWAVHTGGDSNSNDIVWPGANADDERVDYDIGDCPTEGCNFGFRFYLKRYNYGPNTKFRIFETNDVNKLKEAIRTNDKDYLRSVQKKGWDEAPNPYKFDDDENESTGAGRQVYSFSSNVKPGQTKCGTIEYDTSDDHSANSSTRLATVCVRANAQQPGFQGRSNVWDADHTTGWFGAGNKSETYYINDCATTGCQVALSHYLKRSSGSGTTQYDDVAKETNGWDEEQQLVKSEYDKEGVTDSSLSRENGALIVRDTYTLYPGEKICETLNFSSKGDGDKDGHSTVCAVALGSVSSNIKMKVRNGSIKDRNSDSEYQYFNDNTYAKPGDEIEFQATYDAVPQYLENLKVDTIKINGENNTIGGNGALKDKFNAVFFPSWNKGFVAFDQEYTGSDVDSPQTKGETAQDNTVREITKMVETNPLNDDKTVLNESVWTTPSEVTFMREGGNLVAEVSPDGKSDSATLKIPYNFENAIRFDADNMESKPFYAGEKADIDIIPTVNSTFNEYTSAEYATRVDSPQIQVCLSYDELNRYSIECNTKNYDSWNSDGNGGDVALGGDGLVSFNIPDNPAGTKIYVHARVYPVNSGSGDNTKISGYGGWSDWIHTEKLIAKKPSFQVWGGNAYVSNKITVPVAIKNNLSTGNEEGRGSYIFGSWTELALAAKPEPGDSGIVSGSNVNMIGSGASLGYAELRGPDSTLIPSRNPENGLGNNAAGMSPGGGSSIDEVNLLRFGAGGFSIPSIESVEVMMGYNGDPESDLPDYDVTVSETTFYRNEGDISISHDISVDRDFSRGSLSEVPKVVVYAKNINIKCSVARIDAILIAKETINTCSDINGEGLKSSSGASNQLIINGALYARTINFNRTYGAATGNNSIVPAEIINYDNSLLISGATSRSSEGELNVEATFELAPRF